ncbi:CHAT domain-containing protein [Lactarius vividus]|nr:CHAT domain-containing protein [Lactarius vividus]
MADLPKSIDEIGSFIARSQEFLLRLPRSHPVRLTCIHNLATARLDRYALSDAADDLDKSIVHLVESILLPPRLWLEHGPMILHTLWLLASALFRRSKVSRQPEDAIFACNYLRYLLDQPRDVSGVPRRLVTTMLVDALAFQVNLKAGNAMQNIREMAVLCRELLALDMSDGDTTHSILHFAKAVSSAIRPWVPDQPLDQVIECLRLVKMHKPELRDAQFALAFCLGTRYCMTFVNVDYEEAASMMDEIIASSSPGDSRDDSSPPEEHSFNPLVNYSLEDTEKQRFHYFGSIEGLGARSGDSLVSRLVEAFGRKDESDDSEFSRVYKKAMHLEDILSFIQNNDVIEIEEVIEDGRATLASSDQSSSFAFYIFALFGLILSEAFKRTNEIRYLDESMSTLSRVLEYPFARHIRPGILRLLSWSLLTRSVCFRGRRMQDVDEGVKLLSQCVNDGHASLPDRFQLACVWASFARGFRHPSTLIAYESAISSMQRALLFAPTLQLQHATLATMPDYSNRMPLDYASYQVNQRQLEEAIETLERGRALLWSEMRHLRTSIDQLLQADPDLGHKFTAVNRDLEDLTTSIPPSHKLSMDDSAADDLRAVDPFSRLLLKQRKLLEERDKLISQIQILPGFDSFLTSPSFDQLRSVASCGPVIIVNHSKWRSDIMILLHHMPPSLIPTSAKFYRRARALKNKLFSSRNRYGLDSSHYDQTLAFVLAKLYKLVGKPVIERLYQLKVPEQSRIWWCPTSVFCSLPLHAMGPIPSDDGEKRYFLDLYICSYTPTLSALIQSRNRNLGSRSSERPSLLLVAQPNPSLPTVKGEIQVVQALDTKVTSLISDAATPAAVIDGFRHHQFVHFACHGTLEAGKPFEAGFELYGDERLTLLEIVTEGSIVDEVLHLAAAVQYCGFKSVVGTMWAMVDEDGRDLAEHFYKALFSTTSRRDQGVPYHERSAKALRFAVKKLRKKKWISLERWVNFVHYGA